MNTEKQVMTNSIAMARAVITMEPNTLNELLAGEDAKFQRLIGLAQQAGIKAAKKTQESIPASIPLPENTLKIGLKGKASDCLEIQSTITTKAERTSAKMEALSAASIVAFTLQNLCQKEGDFMKVQTVEVVEPAAS